MDMVQINDEPHPMDIVTLKWRYLNHECNTGVLLLQEGTHFSLPGSEQQYHHASSGILSSPKQLCEQGTRC